MFFNVGPERLELPVRDAADLQSAPMPSPVTTPFYHCRIENLNKDSALITSSLLLTLKIVYLFVLYLLRSWESNPLLSAYETDVIYKYPVSLDRCVKKYSILTNQALSVHNHDSNMRFELI